MPPSHDLSALDVRLPAPRRGGAYRTSAALVAVGMVALPLLYVALLAALAAAVVWYAVHGPELIGGLRVGFLTLFAYLSPLFVGGMALLFLVKPLFARRARRGRPVVLRAADEPQVFAFVERLAEAVGAPAPREIRVDVQPNASASFRRGLLSMASDDLVLTVGLPLADALTVRQFAGVLAHEFGHFTQGGGMRLTYVVESVSRWFERVVYERDAWDDWLAGALATTTTLYGGAALRLASAAVDLGRWVLRGLMTVGRRLSRSLLRQMEFDADGFEVRVAGVDAFRATSERLVTLGLAHGTALGDVERLHREGRVPDDLPAFVAASDADLPDDLREIVLDDVRTARTGPLDTHPSLADRVAHAERIASAGLALPDAPARTLFADFDATSRRATAAFYDAVFGDEAARLTVVDTADAVAEKAVDRGAFEALDRVVHGVGGLPLTVPEPVDPGPAPAAALDGAAEATRALAEAAREAARVEGQARYGLRGLLAAKALLRASVPVDPAAYDLTEATHAAIESRREAFQADLDAHRPALDAFHAAVVRHVGLALAVAPDPSDARWLAALRAVLDADADLRAVGDDLEVAEAMLATFRQTPSAEHAAHLAIERAGAIHTRLVGLRPRLEAVRYPGHGDLSLADFALAVVPARSEAGQTLDAAHAVRNALADVEARAWAALALATERAHAVADAL